MLTNLKVQDFAIIEDVDISFKNGLTVLTGETGAGKSILIDAINAILGNRTTKEIVRAGASKSVIFAFFEAPDF